MTFFQYFKQMGVEERRTESVERGKSHKKVQKVRVRKADGESQKWKI